MLSLFKAIEMGLIQEGDSVYFGNLYPKTTIKLGKSGEVRYEFSFEDYGDAVIKGDYKCVPFGTIEKKDGKIVIRTNRKSGSIDQSILSNTMFGITAVALKYNSYKCMWPYIIYIEEDIDVEFVGEDEFPVLYLPEHAAYSIP